MVLKEIYLSCEWFIINRNWNICYELFVNILWTLLKQKLVLSLKNPNLTKFSKFFAPTKSFYVTCWFPTTASCWSFSPLWSVSTGSIFWNWILWKFFLSYCKKWDSMRSCLRTFYSKANQLELLQFLCFCSKQKIFQKDSRATSPMENFTSGQQA